MGRISTGEGRIYQSWMGPSVEQYLRLGDTLKDWANDNNLVYNTVLTWVRIDPVFRWYRDTGVAVHNKKHPPEKPENRGGHFSNNASVNSIFKRISECSTPVQMREWVRNYRGALENERVLEAFKDALMRAQFRFSSSTDQESILDLIDDLDTPDIFKSAPITDDNPYSVCDAVLVDANAEAVKASEPAIKTEQITKPADIQLEKPKLSVQIENLTNNLWEETRKELYLIVIQGCEGRKTRAAKMLGISYRNFYNHMARANFKDRIFSKNITIELAGFKCDLWEKVEKELMLTLIDIVGKNQTKLSRVMGLTPPTVRHKLQQYLLS